MIISIIIRIDFISINKIMEAIYPLEGTYLTLLPIELRKLLYFYVNTAYVKYNIEEVIDDIFVSVSKKNIEWFQYLLIFERKHMQLTNILTFIEFLKKQLKVIPVSNTEIRTRKLDINSVTSLSVSFTARIIIKNFTDNTKTISIGGSSLPLSIETIQMLENIYNMLKK